MNNEEAGTAVNPRFMLTNFVIYYKVRYFFVKGLWGKFKKFEGISKLDEPFYAD
jgi:hypothetical protein